jgi:glycosyltransferase involved in cell wall biosynthesis
MMCNLDKITPLILTYNEAPNIQRTLSMLGWAKRIVIVDSGSSDETLAILARYPTVEAVHRPFDNYADQWNFGVGRIVTDWVLSLDADYVLTDQLVDELSRIPLEREIAGYEASFIYCVHGRPLRASLYPPRVIVFRRALSIHFNSGHTQRLRVNGPIGRFVGKVYHDDRKSLSRWLSSQQNYARREAEFLLSKTNCEIKFAHRLRLFGFVTPLLIFVYTLIVKRCLFEGWHGWFYVLQRTLAEALIVLEIADRKMSERHEG